MAERRRLLRAVIDTNLFVSGLIRRAGIPYALLEAGRPGLFLLLMSLPQRAELEDVLRRSAIAVRYRPSEQEIADMLLLVDARGRRVLLRRRLPVRVRDAKDEMVLASALGGKADYRVTGDADLLVLNGDARLGKLRTVNARDFLQVLPGQGTAGFP